VLDEALGTSEADGAGAGIVADIALLAEQKRAAVAEVERLVAAEKRVREQGEIWRQMGGVFARCAESLTEALDGGETP